MKKYKVLFLALLVINLLVISVCALLVSLPGSNNPPDKTNRNSQYEFQITSTKESLNSFVKSYLARQAKDKDPNYQVVINDEVQVKGEIQAFASFINAQVSFEPVVEENGDVTLKVTELSLGRLNLPVSFVLNYMNRFYQLPDFVHVYSGEKEIEIRLSDMPLDNGMYVRAEKIDLKNDDIEFRYYHPGE
ncbi:MULTISPECIES: YpmS family protein [Bacillus]|uniref:DUF2140 domain-containing protein n=2 Tax=Bacillus TaxID=1386 RepID=A0A0M4FWM1_9BACI|nr:MULTISPECIES: YpmS family protein [Bacillus]ALC81338.1 hypothetical protein AM592_06820 [Bacillus gobiensis]MBP1080353.1 uncharacterized protein YpmS [Bacillus capparidis]MED1094216.1 YpmS family protein [Bacillus capparidis]